MKKGIYKDRFSLLVINDSDETLTDQLLIYTHNKVLYAKDLLGDKNISILVFDVTGREIYKGDFKNEFSLNLLKSGVYIVSLDHSSERINKKLIVN